MKNDETKNYSLLLKEEEMISMNSSKLIYDDFQIEQLEERLEMDPWICLQNFPNIICGQFEECSANATCTSLNDGGQNCTNNAATCVFNNQEP
ncbi:MAG TPA: hypothetical protein PKD85_08795 [Saprospiraceae bacterium]|nr:hypothetical protein [Saprospiraceae bacterium]